MLQYDMIYLKKRTNYIITDNNNSAYDVYMFIYGDMLISTFL